MGLPDVLAVYAWKGEISHCTRKDPAFQSSLFEFVPK